MGHTHRAAGLALGFDLSKIAGGDEPRLACTGAAACFSPLGEALAVRDAGGALAAFRVRDGGVERAATPDGMRAEGVAWWGEGALAVSLPIVSLWGNGVGGTGWPLGIGASVCKNITM